MTYLPPSSHVTLMATLRRERLLPTPGEVLVEARQQVEAADVLARSSTAEGYRMVDLARKLGLPPDKADRALTKQEGAPLLAGEIIAERRTALGRRTVKSPFDGRLVAAGGGRALLADTSRPYELRAGIPGVVVSILHKRGAVVQTTGALLEGVWGNGGQDFAPLRLVGDSAGYALAAGQVEVTMRGAILAVPVITDPGTLRRLSEVRVRGLIVGSLAAALLPAAATLDFPVMLLERFGAAGLSAPAFALLGAHTTRNVWLNAQALDHYEGRRPELIVPLPPPTSPPPPPADGNPLAVGKRVRVLRGPQAGRVGIVASLSDRPATLPSGLRARLAGVSFAGDKSAAVRVPLQNLELLE